MCLSHPGKLAALGLVVSILVAFSRVLVAADDGCTGFYHGVASGDPTKDSVVIWTKFTPPPATAQVKITWAVYLTPFLLWPVQAGTVFATEDTDFTVKVDVRGLRANTRYYYAFSRGLLSSVLGTTKTLPAPNTDKAQQLRFAVMSCANWGFGYFNVYDLVSKVKDLDFVVFLGDYIYEYGTDNFPSPIERVRPDLLPPTEITTLEDYRARHSMYKTDPMLQELHRRVPFIAVWDDHETANNAWKGGADNHQPNEGVWSEREQEAIQAYHEYMPTRIARGADPRDIYRSITFGNIATLVVAEQRLLYRTLQYDYVNDNYIRYLGSLDPADWNEATIQTLQADYRAKLLNPTGTILGPQLDRMRSDFAASKAAAIPWQIFGSQVILGSQNGPDLEGGVKALVASGTIAQAQGTALINAFTAYRGQGINGRVVIGFGRYKDSSNTDGWDGYRTELEVVKDILRDSCANALVVSGDSHNAWAYELRKSGTKIALEFATPSVTAPGLDYVTRNFGPATPIVNAATEIGDVISNGPDLKYNQVSQRGTVIITLTSTSLTADYYTVNTVASTTYTPACTVSFTSVPGSKTLTKAPSCTPAAQLLITPYKTGDTLPFWATLDSPAYKLFGKLKSCK